LVLNPQTSKIGKLWRPGKSDFLLPPAIFFLALAVFLLSPVRSLGETQYTMMVAYSLLHHGTFALDRKELRLPETVEMIGDTTKVKKLPLEIVNDRVYKYAPPGSSILSLPFVMATNVLRLRPVDGAGVYDQRGELKMAAILAAVLMAVFAVVCFQTSRLLLPPRWSLLITIVAALGTQVWSTASRVVEPDSWTVPLLMIALYLLIAPETRQAKLRPGVLATVLSWSYLVHPTTAISIVAITVYLWLYQRRHFLSFAATGAIWFLLLVIYSWHNFGQVLPNYFQASRLGFQTFWEALAGNLVSPSRGVLVYVPVLAVLGFILLRYRQSVPLRPLVVTGCLVIIAHLLVISGFSHWWAGHSYGPRYWTSMVPWFVLLGAAGINGMLKERAKSPGAIKPWKIKIALSLALALALFSIFIHARGALSEKTHLWNAKPYDIDLRAGRLWNWRYPQFLAGLVNPPLPIGAYVRPPLNEPIDLSVESANDFLWYGWSSPEPQLRWSEDQDAALVFALDQPADLTLIMKAAPFVVAGLKDSQRLSIKLNSGEVASLTLSNGNPNEIVIALPHQLLKRENVLIFHFPDAESPAKLGLSDDRRLLGLAVQWIEFKTH